MNPELWPIVGACAGLLSLVLLLVVIVLLGKVRRDEGLAGALREETARGREEAAGQARALREEISDSLRGLREDVVRAMERAATAQEGQLKGFSNQLEVLRRLVEGQMAQFRQEAGEQSGQSRRELTGSLAALGQAQGATLERLSAAQRERLEAVAQEIARLTQASQERLEALRASQETALKSNREEVAMSLKSMADLQAQRLAEVKAELAVIGQGVSQSLDKLTADNAQKLEQMRQTVDEKLQGTLERRLGESFGLVSRQLEMVHKSVGEMQSLAVGVGDLKRVLTNVKTRGTWGEIQLGNLLEQVLTAEQVAQNVEVRPGSGQRVEFAVRLPGKDGEAEVLLPIDAKFPQEDYDRLMEAAERGDPAAEEVAIKALEARLKASAKDICDKYVCPPHSTDFALMYLPTEGLYAEAQRRPGLSEGLQREFRVVIAGPSTLAALLNSLQMGFRTLAIQKRSSEVWQVLGAVKTEFGRYGEVLDKVRRKLQEAEHHIDKVAVRKRAIDRKLRGVQELPEGEAQGLLGLAPGEEAADLEAEEQEQD